MLKPLATIQSPELIDQATLMYFAEQKNGGVCSILVNNILTDASKFTGTKENCVEIYDPSLQDFTAANRTTEVSLGATIFGKERYESVEEPMIYTGISGELASAEGVAYTVGFIDDLFGVRTIDGVFVPIVEFKDRRGTANCSYAEFLFTPLNLEHRIVATSQDEENVVVKFEEDERGVVVAAVALEPLESLLSDRSLTNDTQPDPTETQEKEELLAEYLEIDHILRSVFLLEQGNDYSNEQLSRMKLMQFIEKQKTRVGPNERILAVNISDEQQGPKGSSTNYVFTTQVELTNPIGQTDRLQPSDIVRQLISFPNGNDTEPLTTRAVTVGKRLGNAALLETTTRFETSADIIDVFAGQLAVVDSHLELQVAGGEVQKSKEAYMLEAITASLEQTIAVLEFAGNESVSESKSGLKIAIPSEDQLPNIETLRKFATVELFDQIKNAEARGQSPEIIVSPILPIEIWEMLFANVALYHESKSIKNDDGIMALRGKGIEFTVDFHRLAPKLKRNIGLIEGSNLSNYPDTIIADYRRYVGKRTLATDYFVGGVLIQVTNSKTTNGEYSSRCSVAESVEKRNLPTIDIALMQLLTKAVQQKKHGLSMDTSTRIVTADTKGTGRIRPVVTYDNRNGLITVNTDIPRTRHSPM